MKVLPLKMSTNGKAVVKMRKREREEKKIRARKKLSNFDGENKK